MKKNKIIALFVSLLLIPYICTLTLIGISYNALVLHSDSLWRTLVGSFVGALIVFAIKGTIQRPLDLVSEKTSSEFLKQLLRFFSIRRRHMLQIANFILDFALCIAATYVVRQVFSLEAIVGSTIGYVLVVMLISTCIGATIEYDNLSIDPSQN